VAGAIIGRPRPTDLAAELTVTGCLRREFSALQAWSVRVFACFDAR